MEEVPSHMQEETGAEASPPSCVLTNFINENDGVARSQGPQNLNWLARHCPNVGATMAFNFS